MSYSESVVTIIDFYACLHLPFFNAKKPINYMKLFKLFLLSYGFNETI